LDSGSFIKFAKDFRIFSEPNVDIEEIRTLSKNELIRVFKKHASFQRDMKYEEFIAALDSIADIAILVMADEQELDIAGKRR
jgi:hypothetical protein